MKRLCLSSLVVFSAAASRAIADTDRAAQAAAESWLALRDAGSYEASWNASAQFFKETITKERWMEGAPKVQLFTGIAISRKLMSAEYMDRLPGYPAGRHAVFKFDTLFERTGASVEVVVLTLEADGVWRVSAVP